MKILYIGGQKSGKSLIAENRTLTLSKKKKPYYIATYDNSYDDKAMAKKIKLHSNRRINKFNTIEAINDLHKVMSRNNIYIIDCISMWLLNHIHLSKKKILKKMKKILDINRTIVFVLNDVSTGVIPMDKISRKFVDMSGYIGQMITESCDEVIRVEYGLQTKLK